MDSNIDNDKSTMSLNDSSIKSPTRKSKRGVITDAPESHNGNDNFSKSGPLLVSNNVPEQNPENQLRLDNIHLKLQLEAGLKIIENIKKNVCSYEIIIQKLNSAERKNVFAINENPETAKFLEQLYFGNETDSDQLFRKASRRNAESPIKQNQDITTLNSEHITEIVHLQNIIKKYKAKVKDLENKLDTKEYLTESPTESDEPSEHSVFLPKHNLSKSTGGKRGRPRKASKPLGRPRKSVPTNDTRSTSTEPKPKKSVGRPKRSFPKSYPTKYLVTGEPVEKKPRGRPRRSLLEDESETLNNTTNKSINDDNDSSTKTEKDGSEERKDNMETKKSPRRNLIGEEVTTGNGNKRSRGRPKKSIVGDSNKRGRGRSKASNEEKNDEENGDLIQRKSRGRPKKVRAIDGNGSSDSQ